MSDQAILFSGLEYSVKVCLENCKKISNTDMCEELMNDTKHKQSLSMCTETNVTSNDIVNVEEVSSSEKFSIGDKFLPTSQKRLSRPAPVHVHKPAEVCIRIQ